MLGDKMFCGLDVGEQTIKTCLLRVKKPDESELLGVVENHTKGFRYGAITNLGDFVECITVSLNQLAKQTSTKIKEVQFGLGADLLESRRSSAVIPLIDRGSRMINAQDLKGVNHQACLLGVKQEEEVVHDFPQSYKVDDANVQLNPLGAYGRKLEVDSFLLVTKTPACLPILQAVQKAGFQTANIFSSNYAASEVTCTPQMRQEGCAFVDLGGRFTNIFIFSDGILKVYEKISLGGEHLTRAIASTLNLPFDIAEELKKNYGAALTDDKENQEEVLVKNDIGYKPVKRELIYQAIEPEMSALMDQIANSIKGPFYSQLKAGIHMVGGAASFSGLLERVEGALEMPVHMGKINISNLVGNKLNAFASVIGLAKLGFTKTLSYSILNRANSQSIETLPNRVKNLLQEYF